MGHAHRDVETWSVRDASRGSCRHAAAVAIAVCLVGAVLPAAGGATLVAPLRPPGSVAARIQALDPNVIEFPDSSLTDFSFLLEPPAGKHGFLLPGRDGHFYFQDGTRGRFWGINVAKDAVFQPHSTLKMCQSFKDASFGVGQLSLHDLFCNSHQRLGSRKADVVCNRPHGLPDRAQILKFLPRLLRSIDISVS